jgi:5,10-methylenetetrahydromethanopterin reductase
VELWLHAFAFPHRVAATATWAEERGFDGILVADSQNLNADAWMELALAAEATERIGLGTGVTNPLTRHPAVTAAAAATLQEESGGRAVLGLGRGDSALAQIGRPPAHVSELERALVRIQAFLSGATADLDEGPSRIGWIAASEQPKVPVAIAATGPQVIAVGARHAEQIDFTVGAEPDRLRWAVAAAREAGAGDGTSLGAFVNVGVHRERAVARDLVRGSTAIFARFATEGAPPDGLSDVTRRGIDEVAAGYDESRHGQAGAAHARRLGGDFIDRFAVVGDPEEVAERLREIAALGIERIIAVPGSLDADPEQLAESNDLLATAVLPALR